jgi:hypothetical protein
MSDQPTVSTDSTALSGLVLATTKRHARYAKMTEAGKPTGSSYYYPGLLVYQRKGRRTIYMDEDDGSVCIYRWQVDGEKPRLDLYLAPNPMNPAVLKRCLERANEFNGDSSARVLRIDEKDAKAVASAGLKLRKRRQQFLFSPRNYEELTGSSLRTIRRNVSAIEELSNIEVRQYQQDDEEACTELLNAWVVTHRGQHENSGGIGFSRRLIKLVGKLPADVLTGQVVTMDGKLVGYSFGGSIHSRLACFYDTKCEQNIKGLTYFVRRSFFLHLSDYPIVNDGSDVGREGLRQIKQSFRPVALHQEYRANQIADQ